MKGSRATSSPPPPSSSTTAASGPSAPTFPHMDVTKHTLRDMIAHLNNKADNFQNLVETERFRSGKKRESNALWLKIVEKIRKDIKITNLELIFANENPRSYKELLYKMQGMMEHMDHLIKQLSEWFVPKGMEMEDISTPLACDTIHRLLESKIRELSKKCAFRSKHSVEFGLEEFNDLLCKLNKPIPIGRLPLDPISSNATIEDGVFFGSFQNSSSLNEKDNQDVINRVGAGDKGRRYLCMSDGFMIYCLDLKESKDWYEDSSSCGDLESLPIISTLNLLEMGLPTSMGLFKLESNAYMVGGQEFRGEFPHKADFLYEMYGLKGTSRKIYRLSLVGRRLSLSESNKFPLLEKPKFWPIVEKIGDQLHVIESLPRGITTRCPLTPPSHEVINLNCIDDGWAKRPPLYYSEDDERGMYICNHLVVGDRIYAKALCDQGGFMSFDSKWNYHAKDSSVFSIADLLDGGIGRCVAALSPGDIRAPLTVVIGIMNAAKGRYDADGYLCMEMTAVAELVTPTGHVYCVQYLPCFFEAVKSPSYMSRATVFSVDEESRTMCAIVLGKEIDTGHRFVFISTFRVGFGTRKETSDEDEEDKLEFVNVVVEDSHVYEMGTDLWPAGLIPPRLSACFLLDQDTRGVGDEAATSGKEEGQGFVLDDLKPDDIDTITTKVTATPSSSIQTVIANRFLKHVQKRMRALRMQQLEVFEVEASLSKGKSLRRWEQEILDKKVVVSDCIEDLKELVERVQESLNMNESTSEEYADLVELRDEERYLCISDGYMICCMDLKQKKTDIKKVPTKISAINFLVEGLPISTSLFKSGSRAYMAGGQEFSCFEKELDRSDVEVLSSLYWHGAKCASSKVYQLSLVDGCLRISDSTILSELIKPKCRPVAMKIKDQVHVIDSIPLAANLCHPTEPSHEAFNPNEPSWNEISSGLYIYRFVVVGHLLYALQANVDGFDDDSFVVFDSETRRWQQRAYCRLPHLDRLYTIKHVAEILRVGFGSCVPGLRYERDLSVCIAIGNDVDSKLRAAAFLVNSTGDVLCYQRLERLFEGFKKSFNTNRYKGIVISVDEQGSNMCVILQKYETDSLKITTFTVEQLVDSNLPAEEVLLTSKTPEETEFVNVVVKGWYTSQWEAHLSGIPSRLSACFL